MVDGFCVFSVVDGSVEIPVQINELRWLWTINSKVGAGLRPMLQLLSALLRGNQADIHIKRARNTKKRIDHRQTHNRTFWSVMGVRGERNQKKCEQTLCKCLRKSQVGRSEESKRDIGPKLRTSDEREMAVSL